MLELLLSHWATYLFLAWFAVILVVNLWPRKKSYPERTARGKQV